MEVTLKVHALEQMRRETGPAGNFGLTITAIADDDIAEKVAIRQPYRG